MPKLLTENPIITGALVVFIVISAVLGYRTYDLSGALGQVEAELASTTTAYQRQVVGLERELATALGENEELSGNLTSERRKNEEFEEQIEDITDTVGTLEKWSKTDPELLQKYSKIFFLNENYLPEALADIASEYLHDKTKKMQIHAKVEPYLADMLEEAAEDGINLRVVSAFRSFGDQSQLKTGYRVTYGAGTANQFSADQGYSEHQLGTTIDLTATGSQPFVSFDTTPAYKWLVDNAYKYGFILSYPKGNSFYQYEPWHWRFVGVKLADDLHDESKNFYDLDQRAIDPYLVGLFD